MGLRVQKRIKLAKGVNLNISKKGVGISAGGKMGRVGVGPRGVRTSVNLAPGVRYEKQYSRKAPKSTQQPPRPRKRGCLGCAMILLPLPIMILGGLLLLFIV